MLKKYIREEVIKDSLFDVETEMLSLKESIILQMISEGVDDPGILKCVFMAGGPGSGKSFIASKVNLLQSQENKVLHSPSFFPCNLHKVIKYSS